MGLSWPDNGTGGLCVRPIPRAKPNSTNYTGYGSNSLSHELDIKARGARVLHLPGGRFSVLVSYSLHGDTYDDDYTTVAEIGVKIKTHVYIGHRLIPGKVRFRGYAAMNALGPSVATPALALYGPLGTFSRLNAGPLSACPKIVPTGHVVGIRLALRDPRIGTREWQQAGLTITKIALDRRYPARPVTQPLPAHRSVSVSTRIGTENHWWRPVHAWAEAHRVVLTAAGLGPDQRGRIRRFGCIRPIHAAGAKASTTNFVTHWADSRTKRWSPEKVDTPAQLALKGRRVFGIGSDARSGFGLSRHHNWRVSVDFRVAARMTNRRGPQGEGVVMSLIVSWKARVLKDGRPLPPGKCRMGNYTCSSLTAAIDPTVLVDGYGPNPSAPAVSGFMGSRVSASTPDQPPPGYGASAQSSLHFVAACPTFAPTGHTVALALTFPYIEVLKRGNSTFVNHRVVATAIRRIPLTSGAP